MHVMFKVMHMGTCTSCMHILIMHEAFIYRPQLQAVIIIAVCTCMYAHNFIYRRFYIVLYRGLSELIYSVARCTYACVHKCACMPVVQSCIYMHPHAWIYEHVHMFLSLYAFYVLHSIQR